MGIKVKNTKRSSCLHKYYLPITVATSGSITSPSNWSGNAFFGQGFVPVDCTFKKLWVSPDVDMTATSGYLVTVTHAQKSANLVAETTYNVGTNAWAANVPHGFTATSDYNFSAGSHLEVAFSGTQGTARLAITAEFDINENRQD